MTRVVVVDPMTRTVTEEQLDFGKALEGVRKRLDGYAELIPLATVFPRHAMFVDEDAPMRGKKGEWRLRGSGFVSLLGPAVIFGTTGKSETDATVSVEVVEEVVQWLPDISEVVAVA